jgi:hypothetical protein
MTSAGATRLAGDEIAGDGAEARHDEDLEALRRSAGLGQPAAMVELGSRLIVGDRAPFALKEGVALVHSAAERDDPGALAILATLAAAGVVAPPSWSDGLDHLQRAAALGSSVARRQLLLLSHEPAITAAESGRPGIWRELRDRIDIGAWIAPPSRQALCEKPRVRFAPAFSGGPVCDWLCEKVRGRMRPAKMYDAATRTENVDPHRTCSDYQFDILQSDLVLLLLRARASALIKLPTAFMEPPRVFHYARGQEIKAHYDRCGDEVEGYGEAGGYLGDRVVTFILYLNDDFEGGDLEFPKVGLRFKGAKGDAVYFAHVDLAGKPDPLSLHAGLKVSRGEKWVLSQWIHDRPFGAPPPGSDKSPPSPL